MRVTQGQASVGFVPLQHVDRRDKLIHAIGRVAVGMEVQRARARAGRAVICSRPSSMAAVAASGR